MNRSAILLALILPLALCASNEDLQTEDMSSVKLKTEELQRTLEASMNKMRSQVITTQLEMNSIILDDIQQQHLRGLKPKQRKSMTAEQCLADNIYYEAATEPFEGKVAVAQVTMNRLADFLGGDTVCQVVYFKKINPHTGKIEAAFSWTLGSHWRTHFLSHHIYSECTNIAREVLAGRLRSDIIGNNVEFYHADYITASWAPDHDPVAHIGHHIFYE